MTTRVRKSAGAPPPAGPPLPPAEAVRLKLSEGLTGIPEPLALLRRAAAIVGEHLGVAWVGYGEIAAGSDWLVIPADWTDGMRSAVGRYPLYRRSAFTRAYDSGRTMVVDDLAAIDLVRDEAALLAAIGCAACISVPLIRDGALVGLFMVSHRTPRGWSAEDIALVEYAAARTWAVLETARAEAALRDRERHQAFLLDWSDGVRGIADEAGIVAFTIERLGRYLGTSRANYAEGSVDARRFAVRQEWFRDGHVAASREGVGEGVQEAYLQGDMVVCEDVTSDPRFDAAARARYLAVEAAAFLTAPIAGGGLRGFLTVQDARPRHWHPFEIQLLRDIADRAWGLMERARVMTALAARERDQAFLLAWSDAMRAEHAPDAILEATLARIGAYLGVARACYSEIEIDHGTYTIVAEWQRGTVAMQGFVYPASNLSDTIRATYLAGQTLVVEDMAADRRFSPAALAGFARAEVGARISVPLSRDGVVHAILAIDATTPRDWQDREIALVRDLADRMWSLMERARIETALKERERHQAAILAWSDRMRRERTAWGMLGATLTHLGEVLRASRVNYAEVEETGRTLHVVREWIDGADSVAHVAFPLAALGEKVLAGHLSGRPLVVHDIAADDRFDAVNRPMYEAIGIGALLSIALVRGGEIVATLSVQQAAARTWSAGDVQFLVDLADRTWELLERRRSEERLHQSEALLAGFMENAPIAMYLKDAEGRYLRVNREMAVVLDCEPDAALGRTTHDFMDAGAAAEVTRLDRLALTGGVHAAELEFGSRERYSTALSVRFAVPSPDGRVSRLGGFVIDLTERRATEAALEQSRASLYQTEKLSALGSLLAGVSHELNNPLSIVVAQAVMLERQTAGTATAERAQKIRKAADRCARIVQTFLAMARQKHPERRPVDLNEVATAAMELTGYGLRVDGIAVVLDLAAGLPTIPADADQLHQIIVNLVVNAQQALGDVGEGGDRAITLRTARGTEPRTVILEVADTGPGVPMDVRRRIFEPFFTTKPQGSGTGVGLSFSQGLAEAHGGRLALLPSARGALFRVTLPIEHGQAVAPAIPESPPAPPPAPRRALVVDDEAEIAEALADFLALEGFVSEIAIGGGEALTRLGTTHYDLIVSDIRMPGVDGPHLHRWIAAHRPDLLDRLAFATGDTLGAAVAEFLATVQRPVLEKPFTPEAVAAFVRKVEGA